MPSPTPYLHLPGTAREALTFWADVFGGTAELHTFGDFLRDDGPADAVAHGQLRGPVELFAADVAGEEPPLACQGLMLSLLGAAEPETARAWFARLADGGHVVEELAQRPWGASDGRVVDRYGVQWLLGFEGAADA